MKQAISNLWAVQDHWAAEKRRELLTVIIYSVAGLIIVTVLVTLANYAMYAHAAAQQ
jgi:hypothetical protein